MTPLRIVALDLSLAATGIAATHNHNGEPGLIARTVHTSRTVPQGIDVPRILQVLTDVAAAIRCRPHLVVIEWLPAFDGKGDTSLRLAELHGAVKVWLATRPTPVRWVDVKPTYLQMYATGKGRATKTDVRAAVTATYGRLVHIDDDDQADAVALLALALDAYSQPLASVPATHRRAVSAVKWPDLPWDAPTGGAHSTSAAGRGQEAGTR